MKRDSTVFFKSSICYLQIDSTALAHTVLAKAGNHPPFVLQSLETTIANVNCEGVVEVYFDPLRRGRVDPVVCANAIYFVHFFGKNFKTQATEQFIYDTLVLGSYLDRMRYYPSEDAFLYAVSRLLDFPSLKEKFIQPLSNRLKKQRLTPGTALDLAMRILCAKKLGWPIEKEEIELASLQEADGGWPICPFFKNGSSNQFWGSRAITTAFAIQALSGLPASD